MSPLNDEKEKHWKEQDADVFACFENDHCYVEEPLRRTKVEHHRLFANQLDTIMEEDDEEEENDYDENSDRNDDTKIALASIISHFDYNNSSSSSKGGTNNETKPDNHSAICVEDEDRKSTLVSPSSEDYDEKQNTTLLHRILSSYYAFLHRFRWLLLLDSVLVICICGYFSMKLQFPSTSEIDIVNENIEYQTNFTWKKNILIEQLRYEATIGKTWTTPADTENLNNSNSWSQMVLDDAFDYSTESAQIFLCDFCPSLFEQEFTYKASPTYNCPIYLFDNWLKQRSKRHISALQNKDSMYTYPDAIYSKFCSNTTGLPIPQDIFNPCIGNWPKQSGVSLILSRNGKMKTIDFYYLGRVNSTNHELDHEYNLIENWMESIKADAPTEVSNFHFGSGQFWDYDTRQQMFSTALSSSLPALGTAAVVILFHNRSFAMMIFSVLSILYVLVSVVSILVVLGWTLGFLEGICFLILIIGVSADFVIHFVHAYTCIPGDVNRHKRTKLALLRMGPIILAASFTTISSSIIMMVTTPLYFQKFGIVLFLTVVQATTGSFVVFLTLADCFGPSNPTYTETKSSGIFVE